MADVDDYYLIPQRIESSINPRNTFPADSPAPSTEAFPDYTTPQPTKAAPPLAKDSIEPPLPDETGGNMDKTPSFK